MHNIIVRVWKGDAPTFKLFLYIPLFIISYLYRICLIIREYMYKMHLIKPELAPIPVVSIGNITVGGTGKTPVVEKLSIIFKSEGFRPGIITRGYKRKRKGTFCVDQQNDTAEDVGDEPLMLAQKTMCPVIVGTNRSAAIAKGIEEKNIDIAVLDDGFQLRNIIKDIEILVLDGKTLKNNNDLFPLGPYREPLKNIENADIILMNKGEPDNRVMKLMGNKPLYKMQYKPLHLNNVKYSRMGHYNLIRGKRILAFAGLGDNESFFKLLRELGAHVVYEIEYPDHHAYSQKDLDSLSSYKDIPIMVTTEKDSVKFANLHVPENLFALVIEAKIEREKDFFESIIKIIKERPCQQESLSSTQH